MTRRRPAPGFSVSTKGHSVLRKYAYSSPPSQRRYGYGLDYSNVSPVRSRYYSGEEDYLNSAVQRATSIGTDALYDTYDTANMSRNRDYDLISATNSAIPPSPFSAVKARLSRISSNLPHRRFPSQHFTSRSDISPIRDLDTSDTTSLVASPSPRPSAVHIPHTSHSTYRHSPLPDTSDKLYRDSDTSHLVASPAPQPAILPHRLHSLSHRAGLSTPITAGSTWNDFNLPVPTQATVLSERPILDDPNLASLPEQRSSTLVHGYLSPSLVAKYGGSPIISPIGSGTQTPIRSNYLTRSKYADIPSLALSMSNTGLEYEPDTKYTGQRHRVLGTKRYTGNYYDRLCKKRLGRENRSKYWPYYDVESIGQSDDSDVLSDEEYGTSSYTPVSYRDTEDYTTDNYVPFKPRYDTLTSPGLLEMSPYNESASKPDLSYLSSSNLLPKYKPSTSTDVSKYNEHDSVISSLVAKSVQKAKEHLKGINWGKYENASLVLSVEGDVVHPNNGERYGFRYYPEPVSVHGRADLTERLAGVAPKELSSGDQVFFNYVSKMRDFRDGVRNRHGDMDTYSYKPRYDSNLSKTILTRLPPLQSGHPSYIPQTTFKKRLDGGLTHQVDVFSLPMSDQAFPSSLQLSTKPKSNEKHDGYSREGPVTVLDRILIKAAIVASKLEDEPGTRRRRTPRSKYAADKYRATHKVGENPLYYSPDPNTAGLTASRGTVQKVTERKAVRDSEGNFTKPRNILSWQYRLDSRVPPEEVLYRPTTFNRMRERLHEAQDKMDRHRQLLDRYIPDETSESIESRVNRKLNELEQRDSSGGSKASGPSGPPVSETRRRIRRVLNGTRR